jgi:hypothetical protein
VNSRALQVTMVVMTSTMLALPGYARGGGGIGGGHSFGGGGFGGGHSFGGGRSFGSSGLEGHSFGGAGRSFSGGASHDFGGFSNMSGGRSLENRGSMSGFENRGNMSGFENRGNMSGFENRGNMSGFENRGNMNGFENRANMNGFGNRANLPDHLPTDGGFGGISGIQNRNPQRISEGNLKNQGQSMRNNFNNNNIDKNNNFNNINNYNVNRYGGYGHYGYGGYGSGWAHGWNASNAYHGYWGYPGAWCNPAWSEATMWTCMGLTSLTTFLGMGMMGAAMSSGGGKNNNASSNYSPSTVIYEGDNVYVGGQPAGTSAQYYQQAQQLAAQAYANSNNSQYPPTAPNYVSTNSSSQDQMWAPLGVFALAQPGQTQTDTMLQLAINPDGIVRGNYLNQLTNEHAQIYGALDKKTQRVSFSIGENNNTVFDTSLPDLTKEDSQVLVHYGPTNTQQMALLRLPAPSDTGTQGTPTTPGSAPALNTQTAGGVTP